jgi:superfamily II RNA helicase
MTTGLLKIDGRKFRVIPEQEYKALQAAARQQKRELKAEATEVAEAQRRLKDPKRRTIPLARFKAELGL